jgi:hypothetical protein
VDLTSFRVAVGRGDGLVARTGDAVMYIADETAGAAPLLAALDATAGVESPGRALAKALATIALGPDSALIPPFGLVAPTADGLLLILRGPVTADVESDGEGRSLTGERARLPGRCQAVLTNQLQRLDEGKGISGRERRGRRRPYSAR